MKYFRFIITVFTLLTGTSNISAESKWTLEKKSDNINVYVRKLPGSDFKEFKGVTLIKDIRLATLIALLDDTSSYPRWMHDCKKAKVLKKINKRERLTYTVIKSPWPVSDRDSIAHSKIIQNLKTYEIKVLINGRPNYIVKAPDYVRVSHTKGFWSFTPLKSGMTKVVFQLHNDPGGSLPTGLANAFVVDMPFYTLKKMKLIIKEKKYREAKYPQIKELRR
jgi:ribosome-associated toxin RatA of RatAB toxin-antitoxin module